MKYIVEYLCIAVFCMGVKAEVRSNRECYSSRLTTNEDYNSAPIVRWKDDVNCSKPCEEADPIIAHANIRRSFYELWRDSKTNMPLNQRSEQGGWIVTDGKKGYKVIPFPSNWPRKPCEIVLPNNFLELIPSNLVGVVHTHPFFEGENTTASDVCGKDGLASYKSGGNNHDLRFLIQIANHLSDFCIREYIIDGENVTSMNPFRQLVYYSTDAFFAGQSLNYHLANKTGPEALKDD